MRRTSHLQLCVQLQFVARNDKPNHKIFFTTKIHYLQLKTTIVDKYKQKMKFQLQALTMCQHHDNIYFKPLQFQMTLTIIIKGNFQL
jgi:hypothetical protein